MKSPVYKHWSEWLDEDAFVKEDEQEQRLALLATYSDKFDNTIPFYKSLGGVIDYMLEPNICIIKEYNTTFIELMRNHSHKYSTQRIVPIQIIRNLIDVGASFEAFICSADKKHYIEEYHKGFKFDKIDGKSVSNYVRQLNKSHDFVQELYKYCCNYVHTNYLQAKSHSTWHYLTKPGKIGFMGYYYKVKYEDFENELSDRMMDVNSIPFDFEEEVDIINYCIKVNDMLLDLVNIIICIDMKL